MQDDIKGLLQIPEALDDKDMFGTKVSSVRY